MQLRNAAFGQPLQLVHEETLTPRGVFRPEFSGQVLRPPMHLPRDGIVFARVKVGDRHIEGRLKRKRGA